jgi:hypothetical protein
MNVFVHISVSVNNAQFCAANGNVLIFKLRGEGPLIALAARDGGDCETACGEDLWPAVRFVGNTVIHIRTGFAIDLKLEASIVT